MKFMISFLVSLFLIVAPASAVVPEVELFPGDVLTEESFAYLNDVFDTFEPEDGAFDVFNISFLRALQPRNGEGIRFYELSFLDTDSGDILEMVLTTDMDYTPIVDHGVPEGFSGSRYIGGFFFGDTIWEFHLQFFAPLEEPGSGGGPGTGTEIPEPSTLVILPAALWAAFKRRKAGKGAPGQLHFDNRNTL